MKPTLFKLFELFLLFLVVTSMLGGFYIFSNMMHEQYHVYQLNKINQTPSEICWEGVSYYNTDHPIFGGWVRHESTIETISEVGPYFVTYTIMIIGLACAAWICKIVFSNLKGGIDERQNTRTV